MNLIIDYVVAREQVNVALEMCDSKQHNKINKPVSNDNSMTQ